MSVEQETEKFLLSIVVIFQTGLKTQKKINLNCKNKANFRNSFWKIEFPCRRMWDVELKRECRSNYCEISVDYFFLVVHVRWNSFFGATTKRGENLNCIICGWSGNSVFKTCLFFRSLAACVLKKKEQKVEKLFHFPWKFFNTRAKIFIQC